MFPSNLKTFRPACNARRGVCCWDQLCLIIAPHLTTEHYFAITCRLAHVTHCLMQRTLLERTPTQLTANHLSRTGTMLPNWSAFVLVMFTYWPCRTSQCCHLRDFGWSLHEMARGGAANEAHRYFNSRLAKRSFHYSCSDRKHNFTQWNKVHMARISKLLRQAVNSPLKYAPLLSAVKRTVETFCQYI